MFEIPLKTGNLKAIYVSMQAFSGTPVLMRSDVYSVKVCNVNMVKTYINHMASLSSKEKCCGKSCNAEDMNKNLEGV